ncbi:MAG: hypothetical protein AB7O44_32550 [Hyphomicrobiaceae bacterium]
MTAPATGKAKTVAQIKEQVPDDMQPLPSPLHPSHLPDIGIVLAAAMLILAAMSAACTPCDTSPAASATTSSRLVTRRSFAKSMDPI